MKILMTGFVPFGGDTVNASQIAVEDCRAPEGAELVKLIVPVVFGEAIDFVCRAIDELKPDAVVCVGEGAARKAVMAERIGINVMDARIADNAGYQPVDVKIADDGPDAYFSTLPIKDMVARMQAAGFSAEVSNSAGTFVCNDLMYGVLHHINTAYRDVTDSCAGAAPRSDAVPCAGSAPRAGFIHVPADRPVVADDGTVTPVPSTSADALSEALKALL